MTDNDLIRIVNLAATDAEYSEYARLLRSARNAACEAAKCVAMLVAKYSPDLIGWGEDFERLPASERIKAASRDDELLLRVAGISGDLHSLFGRGNPSVGRSAKACRIEKD